MLTSAQALARIRRICLALPEATEKVAWGSPTFFVPPYVGPRGWIGIRLDRRPNWAVVAALIEEGHRRVAPSPRRRAAASKTRA
jgi:hypothetical protein